MRFFLPSLLLAALALPALAHDGHGDHDHDHDKPKKKIGEPGGPTVQELEARIRKRKERLAQERIALAAEMAEVRKRILGKGGSGTGNAIRERVKLRQEQLRWLVERRETLVKAQGEQANSEFEETLNKIDRQINTILVELGRRKGTKLLGPLGTSFARLEHHRNRDFESGIDDNDTRLPARLDLGLLAQVPSFARAVVKGTVSRTFGANKSQDRAQDRVDLYLGYLDILSFRREKFWVTPRLGRQALRVGNQRMLGDDAWFTFHRSFDGASVNFLQRWFDISFLALRPVRRERLNDRHANETDTAESLLGAVLSTAPNEDYSLNIFALRKHTTRRAIGERGRSGARQQVITLGFRAWRRLPGGLSAEGEFYYQTGEVAGESHESLALAGRLTLQRFYAPEDSKKLAELSPFVRAQVKRMSWLQLSVGADWAQGDRNPNDGRSQGFEPVYPSQHEFQGHADVLGFRNVLDLYASVTLLRRGSLSANGYKTASLEVAAHMFRLDESSDKTIGPQGQTVRQSGQDFGQSLGQELDFRVKLLDRVTLGWARFFPGSALQRQGRFDAVDFFYIELR